MPLKSSNSESPQWPKVEAVFFINIALIYIKCMLLESKQEAIKSMAGDVLNQCMRILANEVYIDLHQIKRSMESDDEEHEHEGQGEDIDCQHELKWYLSSLGMIASYYNSIGYQRHCERVYNRYIKLVEAIFETLSSETADAYFMVGAYYFEQEQYQKSLACFAKSLYIRNEIEKNPSLGIADCHYNIGILFKKLDVKNKTLSHYEQAL